MFPSANGTSHDPNDDVYELGEYLPEQRKVRLNGRILTAWVVRNKRMPGRITARLDNLKLELARATLPEEAVLGPEGDPLEVLDDAVSAAAQDEEADPKAVLFAYRLAVRQLLARFAVATLGSDSDERLLSEVERIMPPPSPMQEPFGVAWDRYLGKAARVVMDGLTQTEAEGVDRTLLQGLLHELGVIKLAEPGTRPVEGAGPDPQPIGAPSTPDSGSSTVETSTSS